MTITPQPSVTSRRACVLLDMRRHQGVKFGGATAPFFCSGGNASAPDDTQAVGLLPSSSALIRNTKMNIKQQNLS